MKKYILIIICIVVAVGLWGAITRKGFVGRISQIGLIRPIGPIDPSDQKLPDGTEQTFTSPSGDFSFNYVAPYALSRLDDGGGEIFLLQNAGSGVQVYVTDFTDGGTFNATKVKKELQANANGDVLGNFQDIQMPGGFPAVTFSTKLSNGEGWDVWFVQDKTLYQITADPKHETLLKKLVETWRFE